MALQKYSEIFPLVKGVPFYFCSKRQQLRKPKKKYEALEMEEFVILHLIPSQKNIAVQVFIGVANLISAP